MYLGAHDPDSNTITNIVHKNNQTKFLINWMKNGASRDVTRKKFTMHAT